MVIHFDHSITGIVGPNGCGKSNIVDAFFWVMGEQSYKHMRGSSSDDLIFNGSSKYSPLGLAEATLVLEVEEVDTSAAPTGASSSEEAFPMKTREISVTRRIYRGGEGEYFINGEPARLRDIHELFMDTGAGAKGYSIIEQGQIGKIVNSKPEDRRLLIEDAAGIAKYKARKKESLRKIESAEGNLARLNDVVQEIERNLASLERQAQKAQQYKKFKEELFDKEMTWGRRKVMVLRQRLDALNSSKIALEQEVAALKASLQSSELEFEHDRVSQLNLTKKIEEESARIQTLSDDLTQARSQLELSTRRQEDLKRSMQSLEAEKSEVGQALDADTTRLNELESESQGLGQVFEEASLQASAVEEKVAMLRSELDELRRTMDRAQKERLGAADSIAKLQARAASLKTRIETLDEQKARIQAAFIESQADLTAAEELSRKSHESYELASQRRDQTATEKETLISRHRSEKEEFAEAKRELDRAEKEQTQLGSKVQSLEELDRAHEGFADGPKAVLDWAKSQGRNDAIRAFADSFEVKRGYELAIEGWFESALENILASDFHSIADALSILAQEKQGRARVLLSRSQAASATAAERPVIAETLSGLGFNVIGSLRDCIEFSDSLDLAQKTQIEATTSAIWVVEEIESLLKRDATLLNRLPAGLDVVDLKGFAIESSSIIRAGSLTSDESASLLGRKRLIADLREQFIQVSARVTSLTQSLASKEIAMNQTASQIEAVTEALQSAEIEVNVLERELRQNEKSLKELRSRFDEQSVELNRLEKDAALASTELATAENDLSSNQGRSEELVHQIEKIEFDIQTIDQELRMQETLLQERKVHEASLRERSFSLRREVESATQRLTERRNRLSEINRVIERSTSELNQFSGGDSELQEKIQSLTVLITDIRDLVSGVKNELEQVSTRINAAHEAQKALHQEIDEKLQASTQAALDVEKFSAELSHLVQNLEEKYGAGCLEKPVTSPIQEEMSEPVVTAEMTAEEEQVLFEEVERLRDRIRRLGEVNVMAIEEYDELKKRYDHLICERGDLVRSIENLKEAIEHINKTSEERFRKAFEAIAERFERLFPIIFGGGSAKLSLVYPEGSTDILEAGVDILAQPPGKKVSNITLLSGGEKALTALSMIFAIFMVKPSPFCVLDEVDAPLDDTNIGKFNALLKEMSVRSQFIIVTHNKKTMELNDTLYGVTMEEPGVSKMISIELQ